ncbi:uncharacterized protein LOC131237608 [Magnolia sinica]|uniref:uncharacterized protein LOC131237608 n=1 Tax=Magnolia sinica TaxID=86752 RepID=UPI002659EB1F|nr:uncharacterized protein LOC131237608 [Magnolia sinica]
MAVSFSFLSLFLPLLLFLLSHLALPSPLQGPPTPNPSCPPSLCGELNDVGFPFSNFTNPECWFDDINCPDDMKPTIKFEDGGRPYVVKKIVYHENIIVIQDKGFYNHSQSDFCNFLYNFTVPTSPFLSFHLIMTPNYTFVNCKGDYHPIFNYPHWDVYNYTGCVGRNVYYWEDLPLGHPAPIQQHDCLVTHFPLFLWFPDPNDKLDLFTMLDYGFRLQWNLTKECAECYMKSGLCRHSSTGNFICTYPTNSHGRNGGMDKKKTIAIAIAIGIILSPCLLFSNLCLSREANSLQSFIFNF